MNGPTTSLETILKWERSGIMTSSEVFWQIIYWAGSLGVTDEEVRSLPDYWKQRIITGLADGYSIHHAHPVLLKGPSGGEWTEERMNDVRKRRDRAVLLLERVLITEATSSSGQDSAC